MTHDVGQRLLGVGKVPSDLLARLIRSYKIADRSVIVGPGIGRDAAAIEVNGATLVVKSDPITFATENAARYLVNVNANDVACLGAAPRWLTVTALMPEGLTTEALIEAQFEELRDACDECGVTLIGGHTEVTHGLDRPILVGQMIGVAPPGQLLKPGGARPGDPLMMTKSLAIEGTALLAGELRAELTAVFGEAFVRQARHLLIEPGISVVRDAAILLETGMVSALHDPTEGGLAMGVRELAMAAERGAALRREAIPVLFETRAIADHFRIEPMGMLASGSLLAAVRPDGVENVIEACAAARIPIVEIGKVQEADAGFYWTVDGDEVELPRFDRDEVSKVLAEAEATT